MTKIFITGSSTGLGALTAKELIAQGNEVVLHARNEARAKEALKENPVVTHVVIGDLGKKEDILSVAKQVNQSGQFDVIIHNAGVYTQDARLTYTVNINIEAPYLLTILIEKPKRIIYVSSDMHCGSILNINQLVQETDYSSSKLALLLLMKVVSRLWPDVLVNAVDPGWVPTRMGGAGANDSLEGGYSSQVWLASGEDKSALSSGNYYYHKKLSRYDERVENIDLQNQLLAKLEELTQIKFLKK